jgi:hypothetical protein
VRCFLPSLPPFFPSCIPLLLSPFSLAFAPPFFFYIYFLFFIFWIVDCLALCVGAALRVSLKLSSPILNAPNLLRAYYAPDCLLLVFSCIPVMCFQCHLPRQSLTSTRSASSKLLSSSLFTFPVLPLVVFSILPVFACFFIAIFMYVFFCLFLLFGYFSILSFFPPFSFLFLLIIRLYPLKLFFARGYICIWSKPLGCGCEPYSSFWVKGDEYWVEGSLLSSWG